MKIWHWLAARPISVALLLAGVVSTVGYARTEQVREEQRDEDCEMQVDFRSDSRAVWLFLVGRDPERRDDPDVVEFVAFLEDRLPSLTCIDGLPAPVTSTSPNQGAP